MDIQKHLKNALMFVGVAVALFLILVVVVAFLYGMTQPTKKYTATAGNPVSIPSQFEVKFNKGVEAFNQGGDLLRESFNASLNTKTYSISIAKAEVAKGFYDEAKISFSSSLNEKATENQLKKADYLVKSSDYYSKGIDEYVTAYRMFENKNAATSTDIVQAGFAIVMGRVPDLSKFQDDPEARIRLEKAKTYFDLARDSLSASNAMS